MSPMRLARLAAAATFLLAPLALGAEVPARTGLVVDQAGVLTSEVATGLEASLRGFQQRKGPQIQLLTIPSLQGEAIESYSIKVADRWKPGDAKRDDGVLFVVAVQDHQMRIEVGQGLEGTIPDVIAGRIVRDVVTPYFKQGQMEEGVVAGLQAIAQRLGGSLDVSAPAPPSRPPGPNERVGIPLFPLIVFLFFILPMIFGRRRRSGGLLSGLILGSVLGRGSRGGGWGGGWGGGGGGFGGGGGGGFSGGGASGSW